MAPPGDAFPRGGENADATPALAVILAEVAQLVPRADPGGAAFGSDRLVGRRSSVARLTFGLSAPGVVREFTSGRLAPNRPARPHLFEARASRPGISSDHCL